jgi:curved DNA-binding protein CbpA
VGDLYAVLGLEDEKETATEHTITKAYRKMALVFHPDKLGEKATKSEKEVWITI